RAGREGFLKHFDRLPVHGYSVTIPHKEAAANLAREKDEAVELIHAANTLVRGEEGFIACNTDFQAVRDSLLANLSAEGLPATLQSRTALLLGAGGAARAVAHALQRGGAAVAIANRTYDRALRLAEEVGCRAVD